MARKARNIYKRKDGRYEGRYIKWRDAQGKAKYGAVYAHSYAETKEKLERVQETNRLKLLPGAGDKVTTAVEVYLESLQTQIKQSTQNIYRCYLNKRIAPYFKNTLCSQLSQKLIQGFVNKQYESGLSAVTVQSVFCLLRKSLAGYVLSNAFEVKLPKRIAYEAEVLTISEQKRLEAAAMASDSINFMGVILCLYTGIRIGELCGLMWSDLDYERRLLYIRRTSQRIKSPIGEPKTKVVYLEPKSISSMRSIPMPDFLLSLLKEHQSKALGKFILSRDGDAIEPRNMHMH